MAAPIHFILYVGLSDKPVRNPISLQAITFKFETFIDEVLEARIHIIFVFTVEFEKIWKSQLHKMTIVAGLHVPDIFNKIWRGNDNLIKDLRVLDLL